MEVRTAENVIEELRWRGLIHSMTEGSEDILINEKITAYIGFDPSADSLHIGNLLQLMILAHLQRHGHTPIALAGGGTGMIGDPGGKTKERPLLDEETLEHNLSAIKAQMQEFLAFDGVDNPAILLNNADWLRPLNFIEFLRDIGKHFTVNYMMAKDSVKSRLESEDGISFTEFSYMLLQSYDFLHQFRHHGCTFQFGGSDQWGNITAGVDLIRRLDEGKAHGVTVPLVTSASGAKFGKTEAGAIWLDPAQTSPYRFYQFWLNTIDEDAIDYLKFFTFLTKDEIDELAQSVETEPHLRAAQKRLAEEVTRMVHGEDALASAIQASEVLFGGSLEGLSVSDLVDIFADVPSTVIEAGRLAGEGLSVVDLTSEVFGASKREIRDLIGNGGLYVNAERIEDVNALISGDTAIEGQVLVLRKGKKNYHLVQVS